VQRGFCKTNDFLIFGEVCDHSERLETTNLKLVPQTPEDVRAQLEKMSAEQRAEVSPQWLALVRNLTGPDPWVLGFVLVHRVTNERIGTCGFKGPPDAGGMVEIAYGVAPEHQGKGYATEAAEALVAYAFRSGQARLIRAHTLAENLPSRRVLEKCGFRFVGEVIDSEDGLVQRWEKYLDGHEMIIRAAVASDEAFLREMLYQSLYVPPGNAPFDREFLNRPEIARYVEGWGRTGDFGLIAVDAITNQPIGAVWMRLFAESQKGYGYVASDIPELGMALLSEYRGRGIGSILLRRTLEIAADSFGAVSLSVFEDNPAKRLYERLGFEPIATSENVVIMMKRLRPSAPSSN
jgi:RimJ/RimL family protein N-acetyltransferase